MSVVWKLDLRPDFAIHRMEKHALNLYGMQRTFQIATTTKVASG